MVDQITDHADRAKALLPEQFKGKPNLEKILEIFAVHIQENETVLFDLLTGRALATAIGVQLDGLGTILGEERLGRSDETYRSALYVRITINLSSGTPDTMIDVLSALTGASLVKFNELFPATVHMQLQGVTSIPANLLVNMYKVAPATVSIIITVNALSGEPLAFAGGSIGKGYGDPGFTSNAGRYSEAFS